MKLQCPPQSVMHTPWISRWRAELCPEDDWLLVLSECFSACAYEDPQSAAMLIKADSKSSKMRDSVLSNKLQPVGGYCIQVN